MLGVGGLRSSRASRYIKFWVTLLLVISSLTSDPPVQLTDAPFQLHLTMRELLELAGRAYAYACPPPFGILNPIHRIALRAQPLTPDLVMWFNWLVLPLVPLILMSYLLVGGPKDKLARESRPIRAALAVAGWTMLTHSFLTRRFTSKL